MRVKFRGRQQNVTGQGKSVKRRGEGLGTGPVGAAGGYQGRQRRGSTTIRIPMFFSLLVILCNPLRK